MSECPLSFCRYRDLEVVVEEVEVKMASDGREEGEMTLTVLGCGEYTF